MTTFADIPVVDLTDFRSEDTAKRKRVARSFGRALEEVGFVTVANHGVPDSATQNLYRLTKDFFNKPVELKRSYVLQSDAKTKGYIPIGDEIVAQTLDAKAAPDLCEALVFPNPRMPNNTPDGPEKQFWPKEPAQLTPAVLDYFNAATALSDELYRLSALALDLPEDYFSPFFTEASYVLRLVRYPDQVEPPLPGQLRYGAHHDYGGFTILRQDDAPGGLQVFDRSGQWRDVPNEPKSFVINVGDLLARWTNDHWRSTLHRVVNPPRELTGSTERMSMVLFTGPNADAEILPLPTCCTEDHPSKYPAVMAGAYIRGKIAASHQI